MLGSQRIIELVVLGLVVVFLGVWSILDKPGAAEIEAAVEPAPSLPTLIFSDPVMAALQNRQVFGTLPVLPVPADPPRTSPFN